MDDLFLIKLGYLANISQLFDLGLNISQTSNDELMRELQNQNENYFKRIIKNQEKIIKLLEDMVD